MRLTIDPEDERIARDERGWEWVYIAFGHWAPSQKMFLAASTVANANLGRELRSEEDIWAEIEKAYPYVTRPLVREAVE